MTSSEREKRINNLLDENKRPSYRLNVQRLVEQLQAGGILHAQSQADSQSTTHVYSQNPLSKSNASPNAVIAAEKQFIEFDDLFLGEQKFNLLKEYSDFILKRSDGAFAYQLAVVIDDNLENVTHVVRGCDLLTSTPIQIALANKLKLNPVNYAHLPLICAPDGKRLAKRNKDAHLDFLLNELKTPEAIIGKIAYLTGITDNFEPATAKSLIDVFDQTKMRNVWGSMRKITWQ